RLLANPARRHSGRQGRAVYSAYQTRFPLAPHHERRHPHLVRHRSRRPAEQLLPLVYDELRKLAAHKLAQEKTGQTLDATALVHETYLRLVESERRGPSPPWNSRGHFFAAAEAMRRILVENARRKKRIKRGGTRVRLELLDAPAAVSEDHDLVLSLDDLLARLEAEDPLA